MHTHEVEFCYRMRHPASPCVSNELLPAAIVDSLKGAVLDPSLGKVVVRIAPYANMSCGDQLLLSWDGLDIEGFAYQHEMVRYISEAQVGKDIVFVIKACTSLHWMAVRWRSTGNCSVRARLNRRCLPVCICPWVMSGNNCLHRLSRGHRRALDPARVPDGTLIVLQPYARMAAGIESRCCGALTHCPQRSATA